MNETDSDVTGRGQPVVDGSSPPDVGTRRRHGRCGRAPEAAAEKLDEDALEGAVEHGVDDGVDGRREVAEPQAEGHQSVGDVVRARRAHHRHHVQYEERRPAKHEPSFNSPTKSPIQFQSTQLFNSPSSIFFCVERLTSQRQVN